MCKKNIVTRRDKNFLDSREERENWKHCCFLRFLLQREENVFSYLDGNDVPNPNFFGRGKKLLLVATGFFALGELRHFPSRAAKKVFEKRNRSTVLHPFFQIPRNSKKTNDLSFHFILFQASSLSTCIAELRHAFLSVENRRGGESSSAVKLNNFSPVPRRIH